MIKKVASKKKAAAKKTAARKGAAGKKTASKKKAASREGQGDNVGGRPRAIESPERMDELIDSYRAQCLADERPITLTGLIRHMGLSSRQSLDEYAQYDGFSDPVKRAKLLVEMAYEERLHSQSPTGAIFALKNMGWSDRQEYDHRSPDGSMSTHVNVYVPDNGRDG